METLQKLTLHQLADKIELCDFECIAGPLTMSNHWRELRRRLTQLDALVYPDAEAFEARFQAEHVTLGTQP